MNTKTPKTPDATNLQEVWVTFLAHGGKQMRLRYGSQEAAEAHLRYGGIGKERILRIESAGAVFEQSKEDKEK